MRASLVVGTVKGRLAVRGELKVSETEFVVGLCAWCAEIPRPGERNGRRRKHNERCSEHSGYTLSMYGGSGDARRAEEVKTIEGR